MDLINIFILACFGFGFFQLGQAYALIRVTREENQRHQEIMARIRADRS